MDDRADFYDVAVSFAGEQRDYVERFVRACGERGLKVFYDRDMTIVFWGKNFIFEFRKMYGGTQPRFVVPFISKEYLAKRYPMDEFAAAVEQSFHRPDVYILPVRFGDVDIPPEILSPAVGYLQADEYEPAQLADQMAAKIGQDRAATVAPLRTPRLAPTSFDARATLESTLNTVAARFRQAAPSALKAYGYTCRVTQDDSGVDIRVEQAGRPVCGMSLWFDANGVSRASNQLSMGFGWPTHERFASNGWVSARWSPETRSAVLGFLDFSAGADERVLTVDQFVEALWEKIAGFIEQRVR